MRFPSSHACFFLFVVTLFVLRFAPVGLVMIGVIIGSRKVGINPDNVATPIAASLGDLITLSLLAGVSSTLYEYKGKKRERKHWSVFSNLMHLNFVFISFSFWEVCELEVA